MHDFLNIETTNSDISYHPEPTEDNCIIEEKHHTDQPLKLCIPVSEQLILI